MSGAGSEEPVPVSFDDDPTPLDLSEAACILREHISTLIPLSWVESITG